MGILDILAMSSDLAGDPVYRGTSASPQNPQKARAEQESRNPYYGWNMGDNALRAAQVNPSAWQPGSFDYQNETLSKYPENLEKTGAHFNPETTKAETKKATPKNPLWENFEDETPIAMDPLTGSYLWAGGSDPIYGNADNIESFVPLNEYIPKSQREEYNEWLYTPEGQKFLETFGEDYGGELGYENLRASGNRDAWGYALGLQGNEGIKNWRNRYSLNGVDFSDEEHALDNLMDTLYGDNALDLGAYMRGDSNIRLGQDVDAIENAARFLSRNYGYSFDPELAKQYGLDEDDVAMLAVAAQLTGPNSNLLDKDIARASKTFEKAGGKGQLKIVNRKSADYDKAQLKDSDIQKMYSSDLDANTFDEAQEGMGKAYADASLPGAIMNAYNSKYANGDRRLVLL